MHVALVTHPNDPRRKVRSSRTSKLRGLCTRWNDERNDRRGTAKAWRRPRAVADPRQSVLSIRRSRLHRRMLTQPCRYRLSAARRKQINNSRCLQIAEDRPVSMRFFQADSPIPSTRDEEDVAGWVCLRSSRSSIALSPADLTYGPILCLPFHQAPDSPS